VLQFGLIPFVLLAQPFHVSGDCGQRLFQFLELAIDNLQAHEPGYLFRQCNLPYARTTASGRRDLSCVLDEIRSVRVWAHQDLNLGPAGYEPAALTGLSYGPFCDPSGDHLMVPI
jgi:hypothetical protein